MGLLFADFIQVSLIPEEAFQKMILSIIIPVYNANALIGRCLKSLLRQSFPNFEIIVVDDGSTDNSLQTANDSLKGRKDIQILSQSNQGVSAARNKGLSVANGEWITFIDSDDYVYSDYLETLINAIDDVDFVVSGYSFLVGNSIQSKAIPPDITIAVADIKKGQARFLDYMTSPVGRLYKKSVIDKHNIRFNESMSFAEDRDFNLQYLSHIDKVRFLHYSGYYYQTDVTGSLSKIEHQDKFKNDILYWNKVFDLTDKSDNLYLSNLLFNYIVDNTAQSYKEEGMVKCLQLVRSVRPDINRQFLFRNLGKVKAPAWQKALVRLYLL